MKANMWISSANAVNEYFDMMYELVSFLDHSPEYVEELRSKALKALDRDGMLWVYKQGASWRILNRGCE